MDTPAFTFDPESHTYYLGDQVLPSVTEIIRPLQSYADIPKHVLERARQKGDAIHEAIKLFNDNDLDVESLDPSIIPRFEAWLRFLEDKQPTIMGFEEPMVSALYQYAGTPDLWLFMDDDLWLPDIKPNTLLSWYPVQLSGYQQLLKERTGQCYRRATLQLLDTGKYKFTPYNRADDARHFAVFQSCLTIYQWRQQHEHASRKN